jgi:hypothetical protein
MEDGLKVARHVSTSLSSWACSSADTDRHLEVGKEQEELTRKQLMLEIHNEGQPLTPLT